jgi:hypothetical protein
MLPSENLLLRFGLAPADRALARAQDGLGNPGIAAFRATGPNHCLLGVIYLYAIGLPTHHFNPFLRVAYFFTV